MQCSAVQCRAVQFRAGQCSAGQGRAGQGRAGQGSAVQCSKYIKHLYLLKCNHKWGIEINRGVNGSTAALHSTGGRRNLCESGVDNFH